MNGFDHHIDLGVSNRPDEPSSSTTKTASSTAAPSAKIGGPQDRRAVLAHIASRPWIDKADDDLRTMIPLEKEALAAWMMSGIVLPSPPGFLVCTHPKATR